MAYSLINRRNSQNKLFEERKRVLVSAIGGEIFISGSYKYHVFKSTDSFQVTYRSTSSITFDYAVVGGGQSGLSGENSNGGKGGSGSFRTGYAESITRFNLRTPYTVTVGGAGSDSTIATNTTTISSKGASTSGGGNGGWGYSVGPGCTGTITYEEGCCCYDSNNDGVDCCQAFGCDACIDGCCYSSQWCGTNEVCSTGCYSCGGNGATGGGNGGNGITDTSLTRFGVSLPAYAPYYGMGGGGGGGGGPGGAGGGTPYGATGGYPVGSADNSPANSGQGGGGGGGAQLSTETCNDSPPNECSAFMENNGGSTDAGPGTGGTGGSGIVFIRYKFQE